MMRRRLTENHAQYGVQRDLQSRVMVLIPMGVANLPKGRMGGDKALPKELVALVDSNVDVPVETCLGDGPLRL